MEKTVDSLLHSQQLLTSPYWRAGASRSFERIFLYGTTALHMPRAWYCSVRRATHRADRTVPAVARAVWPRGRGRPYIAARVRRSGAGFEFTELYGAEKQRAHGNLIYTLFAYFVDFR